MNSERSRAWTTALAALTAVLLAVGFCRTNELHTAQARIDGMVEKAFYETCELTESMSVNLRKLLVAGDTGQMQLLLNSAAQQAQGAAGNLALLPLGEQDVAATMKFINQAGDFSEGLSVRLAAGGAMTNSDYETAAVLSDNAAKFASGLAQLLARYEGGQVAFDTSQESGMEEYYPLSNPAAEYPTLLYDGPFSDSAGSGEFRSLAGLEEVTMEAAQQQLVEFFGQDQVSQIQFTGEHSIPVACYEFSLTAAGHPMSAGVTKQGGRVLYALSDLAPASESLATDQALAAAENFLSARGYGEMDMSYYSSREGILTANFAAVEDGIVLYPDLVKVQVSLQDGAIVGFEASGYLMNHAPRETQVPAITESEALIRLGDRLEAQSARLCMIPVNAGEALCYEIRATDGTDAYLVYVDAVTGAQRELMQIVAEAGGILVM